MEMIAEPDNMSHRAFEETIMADIMCKVVQL